MELVKFDTQLMENPASGFASPEVLRAPMTRKMKSADDLFDAFCKGTARTGGLLRAQSKTSLDAIRAEIQGTAENYKKDGISSEHLCCLHFGSYWDGGCDHWRSNRSHTGVVSL